MSDDDDLFDDVNIDEFTAHEALHMSLFLGEAVETQLIDNPYVRQDAELKQMADKANEILLDLYQKIGAKTL